MYRQLLDDMTHKHERSFRKNASTAGSRWHSFENYVSATNTEMEQSGIEVAVMFVYKSECNEHRGGGHADCR